MNIKDLNSLNKELDVMDLEKPKTLILSGSDTQILDIILVRMRARLKKEIGQFQPIVFTAENGEDTRLLQELFNAPLFSPYRLLVVKQAASIFKNILSSASRLKNLKDQFKNMPDRTLLVLQYEGNAPAKLTGLFQSRLLHFVTRDLYANQIPDIIKNICHKLKLKIDPEALHYFSDNITHKISEIESRLAVLKELFNDPNHIVIVDEIRDILFPGQGCNPFALIDGLFLGNRHVVERELVHFNQDTDNFLAILKLMLNRTNEIRKAKVALLSGMHDDELMQLLGHKSKHPFVQKKITSRLHIECKRFDLKFFTLLYDLLIRLETEFKSSLNQRQKNIVFKHSIFQMFFG